MIRHSCDDDAAAIAAIYNHYIAHTVVTFEELAVSTADMAQRIRGVTQAYPWLVWEEAGKVAGYAYANIWKNRSAYRFTAEASVYLAPAATGRGIGTALYRAILDDMRRRGMHSVMAGIALPNAASVAMHEKLGFAKVGHYPQFGWKQGRWIDVGYWQLLLDDKPRPD